LPGRTLPGRTRDPLNLSRYTPRTEHNSPAKFGPEHEISTSMNAIRPSYGFLSADIGCHWQN
jgi:hypothetical protein